MFGHPKVELSAFGERGVGVRGVNVDIGDLGLVKKHLSWIELAMGSPPMAPSDELTMMSVTSAKPQTSTPPQTQPARLASDYADVTGSESSRISGDDVWLRNTWATW